MEYRLIRSKRKTLSIQISKEAEVLVRAPINLNRKIIEEFINSKEDWISEKLAVMSEFKDKKMNFALNYGDDVLFRGKEFTITGSNDGTYFYLDLLYIPFGLNSDEIKSLIIKVYKLQAKDILTTKVNSYSKIMNVAPKAVKINSATTRWGSCSGRSSINFSWKLIFAEDEVMDYVVVHELAHIKELNHSENFWNEVKNIIPDYKNRQKELLKLENRLRNENWDQ